jgi:NAD-dependent SIR2 family protein deacetylase
VPVASLVAIGLAVSGLWTKAVNMRFAYAQTLAENTQAFIDFWAQRRTELESALPNPGHHALVQLQRAKPATTLATQNVDGLLAKAGATEVLELHGISFAPAVRSAAPGIQQPTNARGAALAIHRAPPCARRREVRRDARTRRAREGRVRRQEMRPAAVGGHQRCRLPSRRADREGADAEI